MTVHLPARAQQCQAVSQRGKQLLAGTQGGSSRAEGARRTAAAIMLAASSPHTVLEQPAAAARTLRWPPPRCRDVITPCALRPPLRDRPSVSGLKGPPFHRPLRDVMMRPRKPAAGGKHQAVSSVGLNALQVRCHQQTQTHPAQTRSPGHTSAAAAVAHLAWWACTPSAPRIWCWQIGSVSVPTGPPALQHAHKEARLQGAGRWRRQRRQPGGGVQPKGAQRWQPTLRLW